MLKADSGDHGALVKPQLVAGVRVPQQQPDLPPELRPLAEMPLFKRLAARLFGHGLTHLRAQHRFSW
ncbi:hypothetical protein, partial [Pseudomonas syringae]|uniref:hypothetical protein n=1 Tax=Pseudomonas syringae TaxID=317 RepID=UPI001F3C9EBE